MSEELSKLNPDVLYNQFVEFGDDYADKKAAYDLLDDMKNTVMASLVNECEEKTVGMKEYYARAHPDYIEHLKAKAEAGRAMLRAKARLEGMKMWFESKRSSEATEREKMKLL